MAGALIVVPVYFILIPSADMLGGEKWPAPAALVWRGVAELLAKGVGALPPSARVGLLIGGVVGLVLPILEMVFPRHKKFIPSATGVGLAFTINGFNSVSMFIGALLALWLSKAKPRVARTVHGARLVRHHRRREPDGRVHRAAHGGRHLGQVARFRAHHGHARRQGGRPCSQ